VQLFNRLVDLDEILYGGDDTQGDVDHSKWRTFKLLRWAHLLNHLVDLDEILYCGNGINGDLDHFKMAVCPPPITFELLG
jgi:hypothetical protein